MTKNDYSAYASIGDNSLDKEAILDITKLAKKQNTIETEIEILEEKIKEKKEELKEISESFLPEKMESLGLSTFRTIEGLVVKVKDKIRASLNVDNRPKGYDWLEKNGHEGMIKTHVFVPYKKGEVKEAYELIEKLQKEMGRIAKIERKVEFQTLQAFIKEQLAQGKDVPLDIFGVYRQRVSEVVKVHMDKGL